MLALGFGAGKLLVWTGAQVCRAALNRRRPLPEACALQGPQLALAPPLLALPSPAEPPPLVEPPPPLAPPAAAEPPSSAGDDLIVDLLVGINLREDAAAKGGDDTSAGEPDAAPHLPAFSIEGDESPPVSRSDSAGSSSSGSDGDASVSPPGLDLLLACDGEAAEGGRLNDSSSDSSDSEDDCWLPLPPFDVAAQQAARAQPPSPPQRQPASEAQPPALPAACPPAAPPASPSPQTNAPTKLPPCLEVKVPTPPAPPSDPPAPPSPPQRQPASDASRRCCERALYPHRSRQSRATPARTPPAASPLANPRRAGRNAALLDAAPVQQPTRTALPVPARAKALPTRPAKVAPKPVAKPALPKPAPLKPPARPPPKVAFGSSIAPKPSRPITHVKATAASKPMPACTKPKKTSPNPKPAAVNPKPHTAVTAPPAARSSLRSPPAKH
ncbi:hypothetical protein Rsub_03099 [Raphidocelis subcapitata]|uniref:Uncharacterized protein n=1 Tax=Raphidocelis subcapitata TaxID=307507 RepID=A0A2V0NSZ3_9CHLO|nr:hypothetical protein Rsub_03099 [Raphidocelis subcapitata]|eukprot:GBF90798.1 hypothetical protein Rsub_03099 [Raphidocelis subcapitata]